MENRHDKLCLLCKKKIGKESPYFDGKEYLHVDCYFFEQKAKELGYKKIKMESDKYIDGLARSYGSKDYIDTQFEYMEMRLNARKAGKIVFGDNDKCIKELESKLGIDKVKKSVKKKKLSEKEVLETRIRNIESLLVNENFLKKVDEKVLEIKKAELNKLKEELKYK